MDSKRCSGALRHAPGQRNKWAQLKTNTYLPTRPACKSQPERGRIGTQPLPRPQEVGAWLFWPSYFLFSFPNDPAGMDSFELAAAVMLSGNYSAAARGDHQITGSACRGALSKHAGFCASNNPPFPTPRPHFELAAVFGLFRW